MLEEYHRRPDLYELEGLKLPPNTTLDEYGDWLHETAKKNGSTFLDGIGFAPGLSNLTTGDALRKLDKAVWAVARVGGIPCKKSAEGRPLKYMITWAFSHVLREYNVKLFILKDGSKVHRRVYRRRLVALLLLGIAHVVFFFVGDILVTYALVGFGLLLLVKRSDRALWLTALIVWIVAACWVSRPAARAG